MYWQASQAASKTSSILFSKNGRMVESSLWSVGVDGSDLRLLVAGTSQGEWLLR